ncbi:acetate--CoA ligase family protein [Variovorax defluvii]|uniref:Acetate--CoA ligase family protein n=1 Tax=Variovorax defluvii TaxID=913761 RepID=A0ABP8I125_9BURK
MASPMQDEYVATLRAARAQGAHALDEPAGKTILEAAGIRVPRSVVVKAGEDVRAAAATLQAPLVLKLVAEGVSHKSDVGGVRLNLRSPDEAASTARELAATLRSRGIEPQAWLVEEMAPRGTEVVVGGTMDPEFGPLVMVGLGGIFVEVLRDVAFRICPITRSDARDMLQELKGSALLHGARGGEAANVDAIVDVLMRVGGECGLLMRGEGELAEIDINPLIVSPAAAVAVDARFILNANT